MKNQNPTPGIQFANPFDTKLTSSELFQCQIRGRIIPHMQPHVVGDGITRRVTYANANSAKRVAGDKNFHASHKQPPLYSPPKHVTRDPCCGRFNHFLNLFFFAKKNPPYTYLVHMRVSWGANLWKAHQVGTEITHNWHRHEWRLERDRWEVISLQPDESVLFPRRTKDVGFVELDGFGRKFGKSLQGLIQNILFILLRGRLLGFRIISMCNWVGSLW